MTSETVFDNLEAIRLSPDAAATARRDSTGPCDRSDDTGPRRSCAPAFALRAVLDVGLTQARRT